MKDTTLVYDNIKRKYIRCDVIGKRNRYSKEELKAIKLQVDSIDKDATHSVYSNGIYDKKYNLIFKPKYIGQFPAKLHKEYKNLEWLIN
jgi:hypothetical protein